MDVHKNEIINTYFNKLLNIKIPPQLEIKNNIQILKTDLTFKYIFDYINSKGWHYNETRTKKSPHSESLFEHCINTGEKAYYEAFYLGLNEHKCKIMYFCGLFHDIGKPGTYLEGSNFIGFKGHGIVGSSILENLWSEEIYNHLNLTKNNWGDICVSTAVHMCGYFLNQTKDYHSFYFNILSPSVKEMLSILRIADQLSLVPYEHDNIKEIKTKLNINIDNITNEEINLFLTNNKLDKGLIFIINGSSASGKTTYALELIDKLITLGIDINHIANISRDLYIINYYLKYNKLKNITDKEITSELYTKAYSFYELDKKKNSKIINLEILNDITNTLLVGGIVVIHSLITMFPSIDNIIPDIAINTLKISIWINRNKLINSIDSEKRLGFSIDTQINLYGDCDIFNPLPSNINWYNLISVTEFNDENFNKNLTKSRAHLTLTTSWNKCSENNINYILENIVINIYNYNQSISKIPSLSEVNDMTDIQLLEYLKTINNIKTFFTLHNYKVYIIDNIIGIKYIDGINKIWKPLWARKMRGKFYHISSKVIVIKDSLIRGMEILPKIGYYKKHGITETQDYHNDKSIFDSTQQELITLFKTDNILTKETYITLKVDGSLIIINIYPIESEQYLIINNVIDNYADDFTKLLANYCKENNFPLITISTNGTLFIGNFMQDYFLTSIQNLVSYEVKSLSDWINIIPIFTKIFLDYYKNILQNNNPVSICFESICKNRTTFLGIVHNELAVNYDNNNLILLGLCNNNIYYPHFKLPRIIFTQPWYMSINTTTQVFNILDMIDQIVCEKIDKNELFKLGTINDSLMSTDLHVEGLILLSYLDNGLDYEKIKTKEYYICHNIKKDNLSIIHKIHKNYDNYYPILKNIRDFTENIKPSVEKLINISFTMLKNEINNSSKFYLNLDENTKRCIDKLITNLDNNNIGIALKIFLNNKNNIDNINELFIPIIEQIFTHRVSPIEKFVIFLKKLLMSIKPWNNKTDIIIDNIIITELYELIIGL